MRQAGKRAGGLAGWRAGGEIMIVDGFYSRSIQISGFDFNQYFGNEIGRKWVSLGACSSTSASSRFLVFLPTSFSFFSNIGAIKLGTLRDVVQTWQYIHTTNKREYQADLDIRKDGVDVGGLGVEYGLESVSN